MEKIIKTSNQIAEQMERWFLRYHLKEKSAFNSSEPFTLFSHLYFEKQNELIKRIQLNEREIPVLVLALEKNEFIINTTERFIKTDGCEPEQLYYSAFSHHKGYRSIAVDDHTSVSIKMDGYFEPFGLVRKDGTVIYWNIPTGKPGFAFWNVTKKFEIIGRRYVV